MSKDKVISLENPDVLTGLLRSGARELIKKAVQSELAEFLSQYQDVTDSEWADRWWFVTVTCLKERL